LTRALVLGLFTAIAGFGISIFPFGLDLEEATGLSLLFRLRGQRPSPSDVVVVSIDKRSADALGLKNDPGKWPRSLHAALVSKLAAAGAAGIAFDIFFEEPRPGDEDKLFAEAISSFGRVILCQRLQSERKALPGGGELYSEHLVPPVPVLNDAAFAVAPFPLPKAPSSVIRNWIFKDSAGDVPTLPAVAFQLFSMDAYDDFLSVIKRSDVSFSSEFPADRTSAMKSGALVRSIREILSAFVTDAALPGKMTKVLDRDYKGDEKRQRMIRTLIGLYSGEDRRHMNFYGPAGTITTIPYDRALANDGPNMLHKEDLKGRFVFVGFSELYQPEQKDSFYTVFSGEDGSDISGIELAATGFANLLEGMPVQPLRFGAYAALILLWGFVVGSACRFLPALASAGVAAGSAIFYLLFAFVQFRAYGIWYPVVVPVFIQPAFAFLGAIIWEYADANRERRNIRKAFGFYLPPDVVDRLARNMASPGTDSRIVHGVCLYTDAEGYTSLAESMDTDKLGQHMNEYYESVFRPIREHGGTISNVVGDSVLAIWLDTETGTERLASACIAALEINSRMRTSAYDGLSGLGRMPTRIGIHAGRIMLGNLGAMDHFEYRPVGDIVNATTRLDSLNKLLATRILISESVGEQLKGFVMREAGTFLLVGKAIPLKVFELICRKEEATEQILRCCSAFSQTLSIFRLGLWDEAEQGFSAYLAAFGEDGPARFYLDRSRQYKKEPPAGGWNGIIRIDLK
jgi:adenylate cyclase